MSALSDAKKLAKYNNELERQNTKIQYQYNRSLAQEDRSWQERMANSAHQREISDLKKAGLNPVLSVTGGSGSATPGGSATSVSKPDTDMSLPRAVMDMAIAQLNSATNLQIASMNNAMQWQMHNTPSSNNPIRLIEYLVNGTLQGALVGAARGQSSSSANFFSRIHDAFDNARNTARATSGSEPFSRLELAIAENTTRLYILKLKDNLTRRERREMRRLTRQLERMKYYYPEQFARAGGAI